MLEKKNPNLTALITIPILKYLKSITNIIGQIGSFYPIEYFFVKLISILATKPFDKLPETPKNYYQGVFLKLNVLNVNRYLAVSIF